MGKWTKTAGLLFLAAASVYSTQAIVAAVEGRASATRNTAAVALKTEATPVAAGAMRVIAAADAGSDVKILDDGAAPFAAVGGPIAKQAATTAPTTQSAAAATSQPAADATVTSADSTS